MSGEVNSVNDHILYKQNVRDGTYSKYVFTDVGPEIGIWSKREILFPFKGDERDS